jgi:hypothetical protein
MTNPSPAATEKPNEIPIELSHGRTLALRQGGRVFAVELRRAEEKEWLDYFDGIVISAEQKGREVTRETDSTAPALALLEKLMAKPVGYGDEAAATTGWQSKLPLAHRLAYVNMLLNVEAIDGPDDAPFIFDRESVFLRCLWTADDQGRMGERITRHILSTPTAEHVHRYMRQISRSKVVGGSRGGKTFYSGAQRVLVEIYDELIVGFDGYQVNGMRDDKDLAVRWMDARHKVAAAARLFAPAETEE